MQGRVIVFGTLIGLLLASVPFRAARLRTRAAVALAVAVAIATVWATSVLSADLHPPQSKLASVPLIFGAMGGALIGAGLEIVRLRPLAAAVAGGACPAIGFVIGAIVGIEAGWLRP